MSHPRSTARSSATNSSTRSTEAFGIFAPRRAMCALRGVISRDSFQKQLRFMIREQVVRGRADSSRAGERIYVPDLGDVVVGTMSLDEPILVYSRVGTTRGLTVTAQRKQFVTNSGVLAMIH